MMEGKWIGWIDFNPSQGNESVVRKVELENH
jgi:hypothetical protein